MLKKSSGGEDFIVHFSLLTIDVICSIIKRVRNSAVSYTNGGRTHAKERTA